MKNKRLCHVIWCMMQMVLLLLVIMEATEEEFQLSLGLIMISLMGNLCVSFIYRKQQIIILLFNLTMFLFLLGRPVVSFLRGEVWWEVASASAVAKSLISIELVLALLPLGALLARKTNTEKRIEKIQSQMDSIEKLRGIALVVCCIGLIGMIFDGMQKIVFMSSHTYVEYYVSYSSNLPYILKAFVRMMQPALCLYLATFPKKRPTFILLSTYVLTTLPSMVVGMRSPTMLALLFCFTYYCIRAYLYPNGEKWLGRAEKMAIQISIPVLIVFCYIYMDIRNGNSYSVNEDVFLNFFYQQGISFNYLSRGFDVLEELPLSGWPGYMLGPLYDNVVYNSVIGRFIFGTSALGTQSMQAIQIGHDMKQHLSYQLMGNSYLLGHGTGSIFILEVIHDIGWIGLIAYATILGWFCVKVMSCFTTNRFILKTVLIYALLQIYYIPRADALTFLEQLVNPYFWITILLLIGVSKLSFRIRAASLWKKNYY